MSAGRNSGGESAEDRSADSVASSSTPVSRSPGPPATGRRRSASLGNAPAPTWIVWGERDQLVDPSTAQVWQEGIPDTTLVTYPDLGHMPMLEDPERSASDYEEFLDGLD